MDIDIQTPCTHHLPSSIYIVLVLVQSGSRSGRLSRPKVWSKALRGHSPTHVPLSPTPSQPVTTWVHYALLAAGLVELLPFPFRHSFPDSVPLLAHDDFVLLLLISTTLHPPEQNTPHCRPCRRHITTLAQYRVHPGRRLCPRGQTPAVTSASHARCSSPPLAALPHLTSHHPHRSTTGGNSRRNTKK